jgi:glycosyltransferase involved in cell wall biosynthesis
MKAMIEKEPLISVIIPTKDRAEYLYHTLRTCQIQEYSNARFIVSDDGSTDDTREVVEEAARGDSRICYLPLDGVSGMLENFEFALRQVEQGYVIALGGDDGLLPHGLMDIASLLAETKTELLTWPAPVFTYPKSEESPGLINLHTKWVLPLRDRRFVRSRDYLKRQAENLAYSSDLESPMFYVKGIASTRLVDRVRTRTPGGNFYSCATPDGFSAIALAGQVDRFFYSGTPYSIFGVSPTSQGVNYMASGNAARRQSEQFFRDSKFRPMHKDLAGLPYSPIIALMTADYLLTCRQLGLSDAYPTLDYRRVLERATAELADGLFSDERIGREIRILTEIAEYHRLGEYFEKLRLSARRNMKRPLSDAAFGPRNLFLGSNETGIQNIVDAAYFAYFFYRSRRVLGLQTLTRMLVNSLQHKLRNFMKSSALPSI